MKKLLLLLLTCFAGLSIAAQSIPEKLDELLRAYVNFNQFNGSALVARKGEVLLERGYGTKNAGQSLGNDESTIFQLGSVTKQFTAAVILYLQEQHKLSVKDKISKYFPDFPNSEKITIENLLTHTSGIYNYTNDSAFMVNEITHNYTMDKMIALFKDKPLDFEPGTKWNYSNSGYMLLGYIIEKVTDKKYEQVVHDIILRPLHMDHSGFDFTHLQSPDKAIGYFELGSSPKPAPIVDSTVSFAAGALYSTVGDLYRWDRAIYSNTILKPESWKAAFTIFRDKYGYGWFIDTVYGKQVTEHGGGIHGFNTEMFRIPQEQIVIVLLNNKNEKSLDTIAKGLAAILLNQKYDIPQVTAITVPEAILQTYVGQYEITPELILTISVANGGLKGEATGQPAVDLFAKTQNIFFLKVVDAQLEFVKGASGKIDQVILYQNGQKVPCKKIK